VWDQHVLVEFAGGWPSYGPTRRTGLLAIPFCSYRKVGVQALLTEARIGEALA
jgi:hypothetical protein